MYYDSMLHVMAVLLHRTSNQHCVQCTMATCLMDNDTNCYTTIHYTVYHHVVVVVSHPNNIYHHIKKVCFFVCLTTSQLKMQTSAIGGTYIKKVTDLRFMALHDLIALPYWGIRLEVP